MRTSFSRALCGAALAINIKTSLACKANQSLAGPSSVSAASSVPVVQPQLRVFGKEPVFTSVDLNSHQGYATDGERHFLIDTSAIYSRDAGWSLTISNRFPFAGTSGVDHLGDGDYVASQILIPAERFETCRSFGNAHVFIFNATTLARERIQEISEIGHEVSALAIDVRNNVIYLSSYCDASRLYSYNWPSFSFDRTIQLANRIPEIQGLAYRDGILYAASETQHATFAINPQTGVVTEVLRIADDGSYQGIDFSQGELRWLIDRGRGNRRVHYFAPQ